MMGDDSNHDRTMFESKVDKQKFRGFIDISRVDGNWLSNIKQDTSIMARPVDFIKVCIARVAVNENVCVIMWTPTLSTCSMQVQQFLLPLRP